MGVSYTKKQVEHIEADVRAAVEHRDYEKASYIADRAALRLEIELGSEKQSAYFRQIANRYGSKAEQ